MARHRLFGLVVAASSLTFVGCGGGSGGVNRIPTTGRAAVATAVKGASSTSSAVKTNSPTGRSARITAQNGGKITRSADKDLVVGSLVDITTDMFGKVTAVEYDESRGGRQIALLEMDLYEDAARTSKIGYQKTEDRLQNGTYTSLSIQELTKGPKAPLYIKSLTSFDANGGFSIERTDSGVQLLESGEKQAYESSVILNRSGGDLPISFTSKSKVGGVEYDTSGVYDPNGTTELTYTNKSGYRVTWTQKQDGSGSFKVVNANDPLCPAEGVFDVNGIGTITFADGTKAEFNIFSDGFWRQ